MKKPHRVARLKNLTSQLLTYGHITTTAKRAADTQRNAERVLTFISHLNDQKAPEASRESYRRLVQGSLMRGTKWQDTIIPSQILQGGNTRVRHLEPRHGDRAPQSLIEMTTAHVKVKERGSINLWVIAQASLSIDGMTEFSIKKLQKEIRLSNKEQVTEHLVQARKELRELRKLDQPVQEEEERLVRAVIQEAINFKSKAIKPDYVLAERLSTPVQELTQ